MATNKPKKQTVTKNIDPKYWVQKSDPLTLMRSVPFSLGELKILDTYISRINAADDTHRTVIFTKKEYEELMGIACANYRALQKHTAGMLGKVVELQMPNKSYLQFVLFSRAYYHKDENGIPIIELTCTEEAKDLFFCIHKYHYFKYALENVISLTRKASYLLYVYVRSNRYRNEWDVSLEELRDTILDCKNQKSYQEFKLFKNRVLDPAAKEVNAKTDCQFVYEVIKNGRKITKLKFIYIANNVNQTDDVPLITKRPKSPTSVSEDSQVNAQMPVPKEPQIPTFANFDMDEDFTNPDGRDPRLAKYGTEGLAVLAEAVEDEFSKEEMTEIGAILTQIDTPKDQNLSGYEAVLYGKQNYLARKYAAMNSEDARKKRKGQQPIKDRFKYFKKMLEDDAYGPTTH